MLKVFLAKTLYFHPLFAYLSLILLALILTVLISVFGSLRLFRELKIRSHKLAWSFSSVFYILSFLWFFIFFTALQDTILKALKIENDLIERIYFTLKNAQLFNILFLFFILGLIWFLMVGKKLKNEQSLISQSLPSLTFSLWKGSRRTFYIALFLLLLFYCFRGPVLTEKKLTQQAILKIKETKLTLDDVMGKNLPPEPDQTLNDATLAGIDVNNNGIRDDVELAIFKKYPNSAKIRAALLQYAKALQLIMIYDVTNTEIATAIAEIESKGNSCISELVVMEFASLSPEKALLSAKIERDDALTQFVNERQFNITERKERKNVFSKSVRTFTLLQGCDIGLSRLSN